MHCCPFKHQSTTPRRVARHPVDTNKKTAGASLPSAGAAGSIPADDAAAKEAGKTDDEIAVYKFCTGLADGSAKEQCAEGCDMGPPGAPPLPMNAMLGICAKMTVAFPDWKSLCLGITKNDDGTYSVLTQQVIGAMKADLPAIEGTPFPEVKELPDEAKIEMTLPVTAVRKSNFAALVTMTES